MSPEIVAIQCGRRRHRLKLETHRITALNNHLDFTTDRLNDLLNLEAHSECYKLLWLAWVGVTFPDDAPDWLCAANENCPQWLQTWIDKAEAFAAPLCWSARSWGVSVHPFLLLDETCTSETLVIGIPPKTACYLYNAESDRWELADSVSDVVIHKRLANYNDTSSYDGIFAADRGTRKVCYVCGKCFDKEAHVSLHLRGSAHWQAMVRALQAALAKKSPERPKDDSELCGRCYSFHPRR